MTTSAQRLGTPLPVGSTVRPGSLRAKMEEARSRGTLHTLKETVGIIVPLAVEIAERHAAGESLYIHPSSIMIDAAGGVQIASDLAIRPPTLPRDKVCMAPEERDGQPGNARASVYAIGAIAYELLTGMTIGPGMRRPSEVVPTLPRDLEIILAKSLVADPTHRPDDLKALAQALHHLAPTGSIAPPPADESHLDHDGNFDVDVSLSMLPPAPSQLYNEVPSGPLNLAVAQAPGSGPRMSDSTTELAQLKARLERDKRPRYVVIKDGMDHGPFSAVELLQQIASHTFVEGDVLRDAFSKDERSIRDWEEFAPFAEHARLHRDIKAEKVALEKTVTAERKSTTSKALIGVAVVGALVVAAAVWLVARRGSRSDAIAVHGDTATNVDVDGGLKTANRPGAGGPGKGGVLGVSNGIPILSGGMSCEGAIAAYKGDEVTIGGGQKQADLTAGQYGSILNKGTYFGHCGAPDDMQINICAAVQNGRAVGVSVTTKPHNPGIASCVAGGVRGLSFPSRPNLDVTRTTF